MSLWIRFCLLWGLHVLFGLPTPTDHHTLQHTATVAALSFALACLWEFLAWMERAGRDTRKNEIAP